MGKRKSEKKLPAFTLEQRAEAMTRPHVEVPDGPTLMAIYQGDGLYSCWWIAPDGRTEKRLSKKEFPDRSSNLDAIEDLKDYAEQHGHKVTEPKTDASRPSTKLRAGKDAKTQRTEKKAKEGVCSMCGAKGTTVSFSADGMKTATAPICDKCFAKVAKRIEAKAQSTDSQPGAAVPQKITAASREVTKVKMKGKEIVISYDQPHGADTLSVTVESEDEPKASFRKALQALVPHAVAMCELPTAWEHGCSARSVSIKHLDDGSIGVVISVVKSLDNGTACCLNTPYLQDFSEHGPTMTAAADEAVGALILEALAYVDGNRAQGDLFKDK